MSVSVRYCPLLWQIRSSYATAPPEFIAEARKENLFNEYAPPMSLGEIAAEFAELADEKIKKAGDAIERVDWESLKPGRDRGPREKGNKIEIRKPKRE